MIEIQVRGLTRTIANLRKWEKEYPKQIRKGTNKWGKRLAGSMKLAVRPHMWTGETYESIRWKPTKRGGNLSIRKEGIYLDSAIPHKVSLNKSRARNIRLAEWAVAHNIARVEGNRTIPGAITVHPHPFIGRVLMNNIMKLDKYISQEIKKIK